MCIIIFDISIRVIKFMKNFDFVITLIITKFDSIQSYYHY